MRDDLSRRLTKKAVQYINDNNLPDITPEDIIWHGIRDWGREPYVGANHAWRPERRYWVVMRHLADIGGKGRVHICGEAYSDYHGFIEGALRSAVYALHRILDDPTQRNQAAGQLQWLQKSATSPGILSVDGFYFGSLQTWVKNLDAIEG